MFTCSHTKKNAIWMGFLAIVLLAAPLHAAERGARGGARGREGGRGGGGGPRAGIVAIVENDADNAIAASSAHAAYGLIIADAARIARDGAYDWSGVEALLKPWSDAGKRVILRLIGRATDTGDDLDFVRAAAERFSGNAALLYVDVTSCAGLVNEDFLSDSAEAFGRTPLLFTLERFSGEDNAEEFYRVGGLCFSRNIALGQREITGATYNEDSQQRRAWAAWDYQRQFYFEIAPAATLDELKSAIGAARKMHGFYLGLPAATVAQATTGQDSYDAAYDDLLKETTADLGKGVILPSGLDTMLGRPVMTYEQSADLRKMEDLFRETSSAPLRKGKFVHWFLTDTDGSPQPLPMYVPEHYDGSRPFGLVVFLHGIGNKATAGQRLTYNGSSDTLNRDTKLDLIYADLYGRQNTFYRGIGEAELAQVFRELPKRYNIDTDRLYLMGHSMGGSGTLGFALHYPDRLAGAVPTDSALVLPERAPLDWMQPQLDSYDQQLHAENVFNLPLLMKTADGGLGRNQDDLFARMLEAGSLHIDQEFMRGLPHRFWPTIPFNTFLPDLAQRRREEYPERVKFRTNTLKYNKAYWVEIEGLETPGAFGSVDAQLQGDSLIVRTDKISRLALDIHRPFASVSIDGKTLAAPAVPGGQSLAKDADGEWAYTNAPLPVGAKRHGVQGPIGDALNSRFLMVYGNEADMELMRTECDAIRNPADTQMCIPGEFPYAQAERVNGAEIRNCNLILFGTPESNPLIAKYADQLPIKISAEGVTAAGQTYPGASTVFIAPNPEQPNRYVVIWTGPFLSSPLMPNMGMVNPSDTLPDYLIFDGENVLKAGLFDSMWNL